MKRMTQVVIYFVFLVSACGIIKNVESTTSACNQTTDDIRTQETTTNNNDTSHNSNPRHIITTPVAHKNMNDTQSNSESRSRKRKKKHTLNNQSYLPVFFLTIILTIVLYSVIMAAIMKRRRKPTSAFIVSLAIADLFVAVVIVPLKISETYGSTWQKSPYNCRVVSCLTLLSIAMASVNMVCISVNRLLFFLQPIKYKQIINFRKAVIGCCIAYTLTAPTLLPIVGVMAKSDTMKFCAFKFTLTDTYLWVIGIVYFLTPSLIIVISQIIILSSTVKFYFMQHRTTKSSRTLATQTSSTTGTATKEYLSFTSKKSQRVQKMFLFIIVMYFVCWGPFVAGIVCNLVAQHLITPVFIQVMRILVFTNSFINPLIILITNPEYTRTLFSYANRVTPAADHRELDDVTIQPSSIHHKHCSTVSNNCQVAN